MKKMDQRREMQDRNDRERERNSKPISSSAGTGGDSSSSSDGCFGIIVVGAVAIWLGTWGWGKFTDWRKGPDAVRAEKIEKIDQEKKEILQSLKDGADPFSEGGPSDSTKREVAEKLAALEKQKRNLQTEQGAQPKDIVDPNANVAKRPIPEPQMLASLEGVKLPISVLVMTESVSLLDKAGKEMRIPVGSRINIAERGVGGTLTMQINGKVFVGHESRIIGKVKTN